MYYISNGAENSHENCKLITATLTGHDANQARAVAVTGSAILVNGPGLHPAAGDFSCDRTVRHIATAKIPFTFPFELG